MALHSCKECRKEISTDARKCPSCGAKQRMGCLGKGLLGLLVLVVGSGVIQSIANDRKTPEERHADSVDVNLTGARLLCQQRGRALLRAPSTAEFENPTSGFGKDLGKNRFHVQTYVDAQNGFGAMVRTTLDCKVAHIGDTYVLLSFKSWSR